MRILALVIILLVCLVERNNAASGIIVYPVNTLMLTNAYTNALNIITNAINDKVGTYTNGIPRYLPNSKFTNDTTTDYLGEGSTNLYFTDGRVLYVLTNWPGGTNLVYVGVITNGTWQGSVIQSNYLGAHDIVGTNHVSSGDTNSHVTGGLTLVNTTNLVSLFLEWWKTQSHTWSGASNTFTGQIYPLGIGSAGYVIKSNDMLMTVEIPAGTTNVEPPIVPGTVDDYWRGDKAFHNLTNAVAVYWNFRAGISNLWGAAQRIVGNLYLDGDTLQMGTNVWIKSTGIMTLYPSTGPVYVNASLFPFSVGSKNLGATIAPWYQCYFDYLTIYTNLYLPSLGTYGFLQLGTSGVVRTNVIPWGALTNVPPTLVTGTGTVSRLSKWDDTGTNLVESSIIETNGVVSFPDYDSGKILITIADGEISSIPTNTYELLVTASTPDTFWDGEKVFKRVTWTNIYDKPTTFDPSAHDLIGDSHTTTSDATTYLRGDKTWGNTTNAVDAHYNYRLTTENTWTAPQTFSGENSRITVQDTTAGDSYAGINLISDGWQYNVAAGGASAPYSNSFIVYNNNTDTVPFQVRSNDNICISTNNGFILPSAANPFTISVLKNTNNGFIDCVMNYGYNIGIVGTYVTGDPMTSLMIDPNDVTWKWNIESDYSPDGVNHYVEVNLDYYSTNGVHFRRPIRAMLNKLTHEAKIMFQTGDTAYTTNVFYFERGVFGFGTVEPGDKVEIFGDDAYLRLRHDAVSGYNGLRFTEGLTTLGYIQVMGSEYGGDANNDVEIGSVAGDVLLQPYGGNAGVGTQAPGDKFEIRGDAAYLRIRHDTDTSYNGIRFTQGTTTLGYIQQMGSAYGAPVNNELQIGAPNGKVSIQRYHTGGILLGTETGVAYLQDGNLLTTNNVFFGTGTVGYLPKLADTNILAASRFYDGGIVPTIYDNDARLSIYNLTNGNTYAGIQLYSDGYQWNVSGSGPSASVASSFIINDNNAGATRFIIDSNGIVQFPAYATGIATLTSGELGVQNVEWPWSSITNPPTIPTTNGFIYGQADVGYLPKMSDTNAITTSRFYDGGAVPTIYDNDARLLLYNTNTGNTYSGLQLYSDNYQYNLSVGGNGASIPNSFFVYDNIANAIRLLINSNGTVSLPAYGPGGFLQFGANGLIQTNQYPYASLSDPRVQWPWESLTNAPDFALQSNVTTISNNVTTVEENLTTVSNTVQTTIGNLTTVSNNVNTVAGNLTTVSNTVNITIENLTTVSNNVETVIGNLTIVSNNVNTVVGNLTIVSNNVTTVEGNLTTVSNTVQSHVINESNPHNTSWTNLNDKPTLVTNHSDLNNIGADDHHNQQHFLVGSDHTASGLTPGYVLTATGTDSFDFAPASGGEHDHTYVTGSGTAGTIPIWSGSTTNLGNSIMTYADGAIHVTSPFGYNVPLKLSAYNAAGVEFRVAANGSVTIVGRNSNREILTALEGEIQAWGSIIPNNAYGTINIGRAPAYETFGTIEATNMVARTSMQAGDYKSSDGTSGITTNTATIETKNGLVVDWVEPSAASGVSGSGTENYLPMFTGSTTIGDSCVTQATGGIDINGGLQLTYVAGDANISAGTGGSPGQVHITGTPVAFLNWAGTALMHADDDQIFFAHTDGAVNLSAAYSSPGGVHTFSAPSITMTNASGIKLSGHTWISSTLRVGGSDASPPSNGISVQGVVQASDFQDANGNSYVKRVAVPEHNYSDGNAGEVAWDDTYYYVYTPTAGWKRTAFSGDTW